MKAINLYIRNIPRVIFFLAVVTYGKVQNHLLKNTSSVQQHDIDLVPLQEVHYLWTVDRLYSYAIQKSNDYFIESPTFSAATDDTYKWYLRLEPNNGDDGEHFGLYLRLSPDSKKSQAWITLEFNIWSDERRTNSLWNWGFSHCLKPINNNTLGWGTNSSKRDYMFSNNKMIISCDLKYREDLPKLSYPRQTRTTPTPPTTATTAPHKLASLFNNEKLADIVLIVNGTKYPAHKTILAAHSPLFAKIFERSSKKGKTLKRLNITNMDERVAVEMLRYIYTGKCENLQNISHQLLVAADKYGLDALKTICAEKLGQNLTVENAAKTLALANKRGIAELKAKAIRFIVSKYAEVSNTTDWKRIVKKNPLIHDFVKHASLTNIQP